MHLFNVATIFIVVSLVGVEFSVSAFVNPAALRLEREAQKAMLSHFAVVMGKVMPVWYPVCALLFGIETWLYRHALGREILLTAAAIWLLASVGSILFLVPLNTRIAEGDTDWQRIHRIWDRRHRVRIVALSIAAILLTYVVVDNRAAFEFIAKNARLVPAVYDGLVGGSKRGGGSSIGWWISGRMGGRRT